MKYKICLLTIIFISLGLFTGCNAISTPAWVEHKQSAYKALNKDDYNLALKETYLFVDAANDYQGKMPPPIPLPIEGWLSLQADDDEESSYTGNLRHLAVFWHKAADKKHDNTFYATAEMLYKKALELDEHTYGPNSSTVIWISLPELIEFLIKQNKFSEAENEINKLEIATKKLTHITSCQNKALELKAILYEKTNRQDLAEKIWQNRAEDAQNYDKLHKTHRGDLLSPSKQALDDLAQFYKRNHKKRN